MCRVTGAVALFPSPSPRIAALSQDAHLAHTQTRSGVEGARPGSAHSPVWKAAARFQRTDART